MWRVQTSDKCVPIARELASKICEKIEDRLSSFHRGEILRSGIRLAIFGPPNAGKSSLFNVLGMIVLWSGHDIALIAT